MKSSLLYTFLLFCFPGLVLIQNIAGQVINYPTQERILHKALNEVYEATVDSIKEKKNAVFYEAFHQFLSSGGESSLKYPFDSLGYISKVSTNDNNLRIFTWFIKMQAGTYKYFGIIQLYNPKNKSYKLISLNDLKPLPNEPPTLLTTYAPSGWYGVLYYDLIEKKAHGKTVIVLLGYDLNNSFTRKKIVETLSISEDGIIMFGTPSIYYSDILVKRIIFEYSATASMSLKYNKENGLIVFDHLSPSKPSLTGKYQFYGPDFSFDALEFKDDVWTHVEDVDAKNSNIQ